MGQKDWEDVDLWTDLDLMQGDWVFDFLVIVRIIRLRWVLVVGNKIRGMKSSFTWLGSFSKC